MPKAEKSAARCSLSRLDWHKAAVTAQKNPELMRACQTKAEAAQKLSELTGLEISSSAITSMLGLDDPKIEFGFLQKEVPAATEAPLDLQKLERRVRKNRELQLELQKQFNEAVKALEGLNDQLRADMSQLRDRMDEMEPNVQILLRASPAKQHLQASRQTSALGTVRPLTQGSPPEVTHTNPAPPRLPPPEISSAGGA